MPAKVVFTDGAIPPEGIGLQKTNLIGKIHEEMLNEDKQIHG